MNEVVLEIGGNKIDISDIDIALTYVVADVANIGKRNKGYSYTIKLTGTDQVNTIFANIYDLQQKINAEFYPSAFTFNPAQYTPFNSIKKVPSRVTAGGALIFEGYTELKEIELQSNGVPIYSIVLIDEGVKWLIDAENANLRALNLGSTCFDINLYLGGQPATNDTNGRLYCMPLQEYGGLFSDLANSENIDIENIYPAFFVRELLIQAFDSLGYELIFPLLDRDPYKRLTLPFSRDRWQTAVGAIGQKIYEVENFTPNINQPLVAGPIFQVNFSFDTIIVDTGNFASVQPEGTNLFELDGSNACGPIPLNLTAFFEFSYTGFAGAPGLFTFTLNIYKQPGNILISTDLKGGGPGISPVNDNFFFSFDEQIYLSPGEYISFELDVNVAGSISFANFKEEYSTHSVSLHPWKRENIAFNWADLLPDASLLDLVKELTTLFNLYYVNDRNERTIKLLTYDEYYASPEKELTGRVVDWSHKLDVSRSQKLENSIKILGNNAAFKYGDASDAFNEEFQEINDNTYTNYKKDTGYELTTKGTTIEAGAVGTFEYSPLNYYNFLTVPFYAKEEAGALPITDDTEVGIRFLIYEFRTTTQDINIAYDDFTTIQTSQQYATVTFSDVLKWDNLTDGLYITFYDKYINRVIDGRFIDAAFYLELADLHSLDFSKLVKIGNQYFILNKISQFRPARETITKIELLQLR